MPVEEYRFKELERRMGRLERNTEDINVLRNELANLKVDVHDLSKEVGGLRRALYTAALSVTGGAVIFAFTILQVFR